MPNSYVEITSNGSASQALAFSFPYLNQTDIGVTVDGVTQTLTTHWSFATTQSIVFVSHPANGAVIKISRTTPSATRVVDFQDGSVLSEADLDNSADQIFFIAQEAADTAAQSIILDTDNKWEANNKPIKNVTNPTNAQDAVTKDYLENTWLSISDKQNVNLLATTENVTNMSTLGATGVVANIAAVAGVASTMSAAAQNATDAAASASAAATSASAAATALDDFDDKYLGVFTFAATPTVDNDGDALETGALFYDSTNAVMKVWDGSSWIAATAPASTSFIEYRFVATAGQTSFTGADANGATLGFIVNNCSVSLNGVKLSIGTDFTTPSGTVVTLTQAASLNDILVVEAFKSFAVSDAFLKSAGGTINGSLAVDGTITTGSALVKKVGRETIWVPASAMYPTVNLGCAPLAHVGLSSITTNRPEIVSLDFDDTDTEMAQFSVSFPKSWDRQKTISYRVYWSGTNTSSTASCAWGLKAITVADGGALDVSMPADTLMIDQNEPTNSSGGLLNISGVSASINITGTVTLESLIYFNISRIPTNSQDTYTFDARLHGIKLYYNTNAGNDE